MNYYNEFDPGAAAWLRELIKRELIPDGYVDERSITDVAPSDLDGFTQCHFFAGIGGWPLALQLAGWPADRPVWTGSCPCQPYSSAGKQLGDADERNLWPAFFDLIRQRSPVSVFGEQVASAIGHGWLDGVRADVEAEGYALGATVLGAHSVGAPHIRQRLFWVADANGEQRHKGLQQVQTGQAERNWSNSQHCGLGNTDDQRPQEYWGLNDIHFRQPDRKNQDGLNIDAGVFGSWGKYEWRDFGDGKKGALNPALSCWIMGYPPEWCDCAVTATPSSRK